MKDKLTIELSRDEFELLLLALGIAAGSAAASPALFKDLLRLANAVNRNNPAWRPYEVPAE
ncbi:MAG: hypothetical protein ACRD9L_14105 [Bryobacteraceae bacterium]